MAMVLKAPLPLLMTLFWFNGWAWAGWWAASPSGSAARPARIGLMMHLDRVAGVSSPGGTRCPVEMGSFFAFVFLPVPCEECAGRHILRGPRSRCYRKKWPVQAWVVCEPLPGLAPVVGVVAVVPNGTDLVPAAEGRPPEAAHGHAFGGHPHLRAEILQRLPEQHESAEHHHQAQQAPIENHKEDPDRVTGGDPEEGGEGDAQGDDDQGAGGRK